MVQEAQLEGLSVGSTTGRAGADEPFVLRLLWGSLNVFPHSQWTSLLRSLRDG